ncbi:uncharacterized protein DSM5745_02031 [Aspergillus mulundensis]|uniref:Uncharacterized protein n=1 Tax=Aspergillus mulundensis TaxID=1810919 RepID=A0A3D8SVD6_9EURO|nr:hypothetical protein DSM5745_02031 [Aspergillus mulundensis]RDW90256.1 hypothetical protein DSM5745_02031 [Aspergillus mulundensis]
MARTMAEEYARGGESQSQSSAQPSLVPEPDLAASATPTQAHERRSNPPVISYSDPFRPSSLSDPVSFSRSSETQDRQTEREGQHGSRLQVPRRQGIAAQTPQTERMSSAVPASAGTDDEGPYAGLVRVGSSRRRRAPLAPTTGDIARLDDRTLRTLLDEAPVVQCPHCGSHFPYLPEAA